MTSRLRLLSRFDQAATSTAPPTAVSTAGDRASSSTTPTATVAASPDMEQDDPPRVPNEDDSRMEVLGDLVRNLSSRDLTTLLSTVGGPSSGSRAEAKRRALEYGVRLRQGEFCDGPTDLRVQMNKCSLEAISNFTIDFILGTVAQVFDNNRTESEDVIPTSKTKSSIKRSASPRQDTSRKRHRSVMSVIPQTDGAPVQTDGAPDTTSYTRDPASSATAPEAVVAPSSDVAPGEPVTVVSVSTGTAASGSFTGALSPEEPLAMEAIEIPVDEGNRSKEWAVVELNIPSSQVEGVLQGKFSVLGKPPARSRPLNVKT